MKYILLLLFCASCSKEQCYTCKTTGYDRGQVTSTREDVVCGDEPKTGTERIGEYVKIVSCK